MAYPSNPQAGGSSQEDALSVALRDAAGNLASHPEFLRIKKLIFGLCNGTWENDLENLNRISLEDLLEDLLELNTNIESLKHSVYRLANSLNHAESYATPAAAIVEQLKSVYTAKALLETKPEIPDYQGQTFNILLDRVVDTFEQQEEKLRIKKMLLASFENSWRNDLKVLEQYSIKDLVLGLYQSKTAIEEVEKSFNTIARGLNKPAVYQQIARTILDCISVLYEYRKYKDRCRTDDSQEEGKSSELVKQLLPANTAASHPSSNLPGPSMPLTLLESPTEINLSSQIPGFQKKLKKKKFRNSVSQSERTEWDIFDLRLSILQYINPLRLKLLLFAVLDSDWLEEGQDWSILEKFTLNSLLKQILEARQDFATLKSQLYQVTALLPDPEENQQVAENLLRIIQPLF